MDSSVLAAAVREGLRARGLSLNEFPPADPKARATSVLESGLSAELASAGWDVVTTETLVAEGLAMVEGQIDPADKALFARVEDALQEQFDACIDRVEIDPVVADQGSPMGQWSAEAMRVHDAELLITTTPSDAGPAAGGCCVSPEEWLQIADTAIRRARTGNA